MLDIVRLFEGMILISGKVFIVVLGFWCFFCGGDVVVVVGDGVDVSGGLSFWCVFFVGFLVFFFCFG